jgi:hypothetical protein
VSLLVLECYFEVQVILSPGLTIASAAVGYFLGYLMLWHFSKVHYTRVTYTSKYLLSTIPWDHKTSHIPQIHLIFIPHIHFKFVPDL